MTYDQIEIMLRDLLECIDHDIAKEYHSATAEEPEYAESAFQELVSIVKSHL